ncbi:unnamed protein product [Polarella glacialis]|uniref:NAD(P)-binding domain-containing protein n=1 Tax=Polarella glacialis TaxID=89957 RepID=A0A813FAR4_POLGL|nr:unnamed protein product [Polarella glacialis]
MAVPRRAGRCLALAVVVAVLASFWHLDLGRHASLSTAFAKGRTVLVTGAGGRTGKIVVEKLMKSGRYDVRALVRSEKSKAALLKQHEFLRETSVFVGDVESKDSMSSAFAGVSAVIVVTSAVPKVKIWSLFPFLVGKLLGRKWKLKFTWKGNKPEQVDWVGQRNQFDLALEKKAKQVIVVSTMTGTQKDSFLNSIGEGEGDNIVMWKRKAEMYLIDLCRKTQSPNEMKYTIIHPGGLGDSEGGKDKVTVGVDDTLREVKPSYRIQRADVAEACVQALECQEALDRSFDLGSTDDGQPLLPAGLKAILEPLKGANCDYSINPPPE